MKIKESILDYLLPVFRIIRLRIYLLKMVPSQNKLAKTKKNQEEAFLELRKDFAEKYFSIDTKKYKYGKFVAKLWKGYDKKLEKVLLPYPPFSFLRHPMFMKSFFATSGGKWLEKEIAYLSKRLSRPRLKFLLQEEYVGKPLILNNTYQTSHHTIHILYNLEKFLEKTNCNLKQVKTIVEWGGGYGTLAKIIKKIKNDKFTYVIIDLPIVCVLQWLYLSTIFKSENINLITNPSGSILTGKINLLPVCLADTFEVKADLFISTWALSESSKYSQDFVLKREWFSAKHLMLAYHGNAKGLPDSKRVGDLAKKTGAAIEEIEFIKGNYYAFL